MINFGRTFKKVRDISYWIECSKWQEESYHRLENN